MNIKIGIGLDNLIFGMSKEDVLILLGKPNKVSETDLVNGIVFYYNQILIKVKFHEEFKKLFSIEVYKYFEARNNFLLKGSWI